MVPPAQLSSAPAGPASLSPLPRVLQRSGDDDFGAGAILQRIRGSVAEGVREGAHELTFFAMGTRCRISFAAAAAEAKAYQEAALRWVAAFEAKYSRYLPDSFICLLNRAAGREWIAVDPETERLLALCHEMHFFTRGVFDPTALPLIQLWNWKADPPTVPTAEAIATAKEKVGWRKIQRAPGRILLPLAGMSLDLGGVGKEYAVDQVVLLAGQHGISRILVDFGADVRVHGLPPDGRPAWHIGLEDPASPGRCWCGLSVRDAAVATSGDYLRKFEVNGRRYGHIIDLRTGQPVENGCRAVSVIAPSCTLAGMLSTTAFVLGAQEGVRMIDAQMGAAGAVVTDTGKITSRRFYDHVIS
jgi:thiamine biosynthesis lipoprotein